MYSLSTHIVFENLYALAYMFSIENTDTLPVQAAQARNI